MKFQKLTTIYVSAFIIVIFVDAYFPSAVSIFIDIFLPLNFDFSGSSFARYRMSLYVVGSIIFCFFVPIIWITGFYGADLEIIKKLHWGNVVFGIPMVFILWLGYPSVALCETCWTANDIFYFLLTLVNFLALQISVQGIFLKLKFF